MEHNIQISASDHASTVFKKMFPDSQIAAKYGCGRTKTSAIINVMADTSQQDICRQVQQQPFTLATDGSNDGTSSQLYPVLLTYYDDSKGQVKEVLYSLPECKQSCTGENIFKLVDGELTKANIPWQNCIGFSADNASVMMGRKKGVASFVLEKNKDCMIVGCPCHMVHNAAEKAAKTLPLAVDDFLIDIYYYLDKSSKRYLSLQSWQSLCDTEVQKILKHVSTRWLSLTKCIDRLITQWEPLKGFFKDEVKSNVTSKLTKKKTLNLTQPAKKNNTSTSKASSSSVHVAKPKPTTTSKSGSTSKASSSSVNVDKPKPTTTSKSGPTTKASSSSVNVAKPKPPTTSTKSTTRTPSTSALKTKPKTSFVPVTKTTTCSASKQASSTVSTSGAKDKGTKRGLEPSKSSTNVKRVCTGSGKDSSSGSTTSSGSSLEKSESRLLRIHRLFNSPQTKLYCHFLRYANAMFDETNLLLQRDEPCIHLLNRKLNALLRDIMLRFLKPSVISSSDNLTNIRYELKENQKDNKDIIIGTSTREYINSNTVTDKEVLSAADVDSFYLTVRRYYQAACSYVIKTFPLDDQLLKHAEILDIDLRQQKNFESVQYFVTRFPCLLGENVDKDKLEMEFAKYQVVDLSVVPVEARVDKKWSIISEITDPATGAPAYPLLTQVMKGILVLPHSNAQCERAFSIVRKNKTDFRPNMSTATLQSLLIEKLCNSDTPCFRRDFSTDFLKNAKKATYRSLHPVQDAGASTSSTTGASTSSSSRTN